MCLIRAMVLSFLCLWAPADAGDGICRSAERVVVGGLHDEVFLSRRHVDLDRFLVDRRAAEEQENDTKRGVPENRHCFLPPRETCSGEYECRRPRVKGTRRRDTEGASGGFRKRRGAIATRSEERR